ncbi:MAG: J domain-containing protein [Sphingomonadaceae bacterium]|nr:J domain-containing protein [Sphingomonadaceae bacterium]
MPIFALIVAGLLIYAIHTGRIRKPLRHEALAGTVLFVAAVLAARGAELTAMLAVGVSLAVYLTGEAAFRREAAQTAKAYGALGLRPGAGVDEIRAAHRRLSAVAHPDRGGTHEEQQRLNWSRDFLLRRIRDGRG